MKASACLLALLITGCAHRSPLAPSAPLLPLIVQTKIYQQDTPLAGVTVSLNGQIVGVTDATGCLTTYAAAGADITVRVTASDYYPLVPAAESTVNGPNEVWTFWLTH